MRDPDEAELWMRQAEYDLQTVSILRDAGRFDSACFMAGQSAQKAFLLSQSRKAVLKHSIAALCKIAAEYDGTFNKLLPKVKDLSRFLCRDTLSRCPWSGTYGFLRFLRCGEGTLHGRGSHPDRETTA